MNNEKEFAKGLYFKPKHQKAPDFVLGGLSIKRVDLIEWLNSKPDEWINLQIKNSKENKLYIEVDNWKPEKEQELNQKNKIEDDLGSSDLPF